MAASLTSLRNLLEVEVYDDVIQELLDLQAGVVLVGHGHVPGSLRKKI